jgi:hypothetical protein
MNSVNDYEILTLTLRRDIMIPYILVLSGVLVTIDGVWIGE